MRCCRIAQAQEDLYNQRLQEIYHVKHTGGDGEGLGEPIRYGVWVIVGQYRDLVLNDQSNLQTRIIQ